MKCRFICDVDMNVKHMPDAEKAKLSWRTVTDKMTNKPRHEAYMAAGTEYEHPDAWKFVNYGMADPVDDECKDAAQPMSDVDRSHLQLEYKATAIGINEQGDRELFFARVINGYIKRPDGRFEYIPGPNYDKWKADQDAKNESAAKKEESDI